MKYKPRIGEEMGREKNDGREPPASETGVESVHCLVLGIWIILHSSPIRKRSGDLFEPAIRRSLKHCRAISFAETTGYRDVWHAFHLEAKRPMTKLTHPVLWVCCLQFIVTTAGGDDAPRPSRPVAAVRPSCLPFDPVVRKVEGWTAHVDPALLKGEHKPLGDRSLRMLADHLHRISILMPPDRLKKLRTLEIWIERRHPTLAAMQYHPSVAWLKAHGHDPRLAKKVHIPRAADLVSRRQLVKHPMVVLHELAHAYHDQFLGFDHPQVRRAYEQAKKSGKYDKVLLYTGKTARHYGMTNHKEYFAEATEAYFGRNDFYPFVRAELQRHDPAMYELLVEIWGPLR